MRDPFLEVRFAYEFAADALIEARDGLKALGPVDHSDIERLRNRLLAIGTYLSDGLNECESRMTDERTTA